VPPPLDIGELMTPPSDNGGPMLPPPDNGGPMPLAPPLPPGVAALPPGPPEEGMFPPTPPEPVADPGQNPGPNPEANPGLGRDSLIDLRLLRTRLSDFKWNHFISNHLGSLIRFEITHLHNPFHPRGLCSDLRSSITLTNMIALANHVKTMNTTAV